LKQPAVGIAATALIIALSLGFISLFSFSTFTGWVAYYLLCVIPIQIVIAVTWGASIPLLRPMSASPSRGSC
jgi:hypothetical protein